MIPLSALKKRELCRAHTWNAFLRAGNFKREVYQRAPLEWTPQGSQGFWKPRDPAYGLDDATVASEQPSMGMMREKVPRKFVCLKPQACAFYPRLNSIRQAQGGAVGVVTTQIDDILGCGESGAVERVSALLGTLLWGS